MSTFFLFFGLHVSPPLSDTRYQVLIFFCVFRLAGLCFVYWLLMHGGWSVQGEASSMLEEVLFLFSFIFLLGAVRVAPTSDCVRKRTPCRLFFFFCIAHLCRAGSVGPPGDGAEVVAAAALHGCLEAIMSRAGADRMRYFFRLEVTWKNWCRNINERAAACPHWYRSVIPTEGDTEDVRKQPSRFFFRALKSACACCGLSTLGAHGVFLEGRNEGTRAGGGRSSLRQWDGFCVVADGGGIQTARLVWQANCRTTRAVAANAVLWPFVSF